MSQPDKDTPESQETWRHPSGWPARDEDARRAPALQLAGVARAMASEAFNIAMSQPELRDVRRTVLGRAAEDLAAIALRLEGHFQRGA
ncbi:MAG: hypothetical protein ACHP7H_00700 [Hyphomicrobiales bacterium]